MSFLEFSRSSNQRLNVTVGRTTKLNINVRRRSTDFLPQNRNLVY